MKKTSLLALLCLISCSKTSVDCEEFNICVDSFEADRWQEYTEIKNLNDIPEFTQKDFWLLAYDVSKYVSRYPVKDKFTSNRDFDLMKDKFIDDLPDHYKQKYYFKSVNELSLDYFEDCRDYGAYGACYDPDNKMLTTGNLEYKIEVDPKYGGEFLELYRKKIESLLPHREPMLLIDELTNIKKLHSATAIVYVKKDSFFVQGHFPENPVMPGVLIVEAFGQAAAALTAHGLDKSTYENKLVFLMGVDKARFRNPVIPDCKLELNIEAIRSHGRVWKYKGEAFVDEKKMADAQWSATIVDRK